MDFVLVENPAMGDDGNNCTIISLSISAGIPYEKANEIGTEAGRKKNKGIYLSKLYYIARKKGIRFRKIPVKRISLKRFLLKYPKGRFVLERYGHAFCVIDGIIYDTSPVGRNSIIISCYKIESNRIETIKEIVNKKI
jgi:hypothetical protein